MSKCPYPSDFLWGASTASHQVEGGTVNQWSEWELAQADTLALTAEKRVGWVPCWLKIKSHAEDPANYISGQGIAHYSRYKQDFDILQKLGMNAFRFSIEWSRLQPSEDTWDMAAVEHYRQYILELKARGIEPVLTLWHWTMPVWFTDKGGFEKARNLKYFDEYVRVVAREFGELLRYVIVLNEPNVYTGLSYLNGEWPPQQKNVITSLKVYVNLTGAHRRAFTIIKASRADIQVGIAAQLGNMQPSRPHSPIDRLAAGTSAYISNWWFLNRIKGHLDFIGLNYYFTSYWRNFKQHNPAQPLSDLGWYMEPSGIGTILMEAYQRYNLPIMVTENGLADAEDRQRQWWLQETMAALVKAQADGVRLIGYLHWSLLDNFEWKFGWWPQFGLVAVDRQHDMKRTIRKSAYWLKDYISDQKRTQVNKHKNNIDKKDTSC